MAGTSCKRPSKAPRTRTPKASQKQGVERLGFRVAGIHGSMSHSRFGEVKQGLAAHRVVGMLTLDSTWQHGPSSFTLSELSRLRCSHL